MMKKNTLLIIIFFLALSLAFYAGSVWQQFKYNDTCLDMGGGRNPENHAICVIEKATSLQDTQTLGLSTNNQQSIKNKENIKTQETSAKKKISTMSDDHSDGYSGEYSNDYPPLHYTWDMNEDGINDCEEDGTCDHTQNYSMPRYIIPGVNDNIVFDQRSKKWVDEQGICHTCTPENGFNLDGTESDL